MSLWTINGTTFADLGLLAPRRTLRNQIPDQLTLNQAVPDLTADPLWDIDDVLTIYKDGTPFFTGTIVQIPRRSSQGEYIGYVLDGPWHELERVPYLLAWPTADGTAYASTLLLNLEAPENIISTRTQIMRILDWCLARCALESVTPFQYSAAHILPSFDLYPPVDEVRHATCADCLKRELRWHPDTIVWFDYSTVPPSLHIERRANLAANNVAITTIDDDWSIAPRYDMQVPGVVINYRRTSVVDGRSKLQFVADKWPLSATGAERDALSYSIDIQGETVSHLTGSIETTPIDTSSLDWWMLHSDAYAKAYADGRILNPKISNVQSTRVNGALTNELISGQLAPWMGFDAEECYFTADLSAEIVSDDGEQLQIITAKQISIRLVATDAITGDYSALGEFEGGDPIPPIGPPSITYPAGGLAYILYHNLATLYWEGSIGITAEECAGQLAMGQVLNLTGGRTEWASMNAVLQSIEEDWELGRTRATFGPPGHLGLQDYLALLMVGRRRLRFIQPQTLSDGFTGSGKLELGDYTPKRDAVPGPTDSSYHATYSKAQKFKISADATHKTFIFTTKGATIPEIQMTAPNGIARLRMFEAAQGEVDVNLSDANGKRLYLREVNVCIDGDGTWKVMALLSEPYK